MKVGNTSERNMPQNKKAGNRGKRDSQLILINFLSRILFEDNMNPLDYEIAYSIQKLTGLTAAVYEVKTRACLMFFELFTSKKRKS